MRPSAAAALVASHVSLQSKVPLGRKAAARLADFWQCNCEALRIDAQVGHRDLNLLLDRVASAGGFLRKAMDGSKHVGRVHLRALHDHLEELSRKLEQGPTRFCLAGFDWMA